MLDYLCEHNAVSGNPVDGVRRTVADGNEGSTPALGDAQARKLLEAPPGDTLKGVRDRAILATLLYHGIRREELCGLRGLRVRDIQSRQGVMHFRIKGKRDKVLSTRFHKTRPRTYIDTTHCTCPLHNVPAVFPPLGRHRYLAAGAMCGVFAYGHYLWKPF